MPSYSGLFDGHYGTPHALLTNKSGNAETQLARVASRRLYGRNSFRALLDALVGAAPGDTATATHKRVKAERNLSANVQGGVRTIETFTSVDRATDAADATRMTDAINQQTQPSTYAKDASGVGGGGKLGW